MSSDFDAERYTISVRKEIVEGDELYVARVAELPDVEEFADTHEEARILAIDTLETSHSFCISKGIDFPAPTKAKSDRDQVSGRVTLRMPKSLHAGLIQQAQIESVSLNQYLVSALSVDYGQSHMHSNIIGKIESEFTITQAHKFKKTIVFDQPFENSFGRFDAKQVPMSLNMDEKVGVLM